jgi:hypothetical protein
VEISLGNATDKKQPVRLEITYQVTGACWLPSYDIRVSTTSTAIGDNEIEDNDNEEGRKSLNVHYFGLVRQSTGENWTDVQLALITVCIYIYLLY